MGILGAIITSIIVLYFIIGLVATLVLGSINEPLLNILIFIFWPIVILWLTHQIRKSRNKSC